MIPMNEIEITGYRFFGTIGSVFTTFQSVIWCILCVAGALCKYTSWGEEENKKTFKYCFYLLYYENPGNVTRLNYIGPGAFQGLMWSGLVICMANLVISAYSAKAFLGWSDAQKIKKIAGIWGKCILGFSFVEFVFFIIFISDIVAINQTKNAKCFLDQDVTRFLSMNIMTHKPAPYLLNLKSNLKTMKKKIRKLKKRLQFLDAISNEGSPDYVPNPFISKTVVNNYVENIWKDMFNHSIREKVRRKSDLIPFDEIMRNFIINEHLNLDEIDYDLLKNFDGLTKNKWIKPLESSSMAIGKEINLSPSITAINTTKLDKVANLLHEYIQEIEMHNITSSDVNNEHFDLFFKTLLNELDPPLEDNKSEIMDHQDDILKSNDYEEVLNLTTVDNEVNTDASFDQFFQDEKMEIIIANEIQNILGSNKTLQINDDQILEKLEELHQLRRQDRPETSGDDNVITENPEENLETTQSETETKQYKPTNAFKTRTAGDPIGEYVQNLCDNCGYFILSPSILCSIMSLKTGLVWLLNIILALIVLFYDGRIEIKRHGRLSCKS